MSLKFGRTPVELRQGEGNMCSRPTGDWSPMLIALAVLILTIIAAFSATNWSIPG